MEYMPSPAAQTVGFIYSSGLGFALGLVYDFFRIFFYMLTGSDKKLTVTRDIIYLLFCLVADFLFLLVMCDGRMMLYAFVGEGIGLLVYFLTLSGSVYLPLRTVTAKIRACFSKIVMIFKKVRLLLSKLLQNMHKNTKKQEFFSENT